MRIMLGIWFNIIIRSKILNEIKQNFLIIYLGLTFLR